MLHRIIPQYANLMALILKKALFFGALLMSLLWPLNVWPHNITAIVKAAKPSAAGIGLYDALGAQQHQLRGSGFAFGNGQFIATNHHIIDKKLDPTVVQHWAVYVGTGKTVKHYKAEIVIQDAERDLAILKIGAEIPALKLAEDNYVSDGTEVLLTGFPIGAVLGLYPATHRGIVAALTPDVLPTSNTKQLKANLLNRLKNPFFIYQLDITAFPGNSGSAVYDAKTGRVMGVLNKVFVSARKESVLDKPSGISYAIPIKYLKKLAKEANMDI